MPAMCFSIQADLVAGVVVGGVGIAAMTQVRKPRELALASLPLLFSVHAFVEVVVWRGVDGGTSQAVLNAATWLYLAIAFVAVPILVPIAVALIEPKTRWPRFAPFIVLGIVVGIWLGYSISANPVKATPYDHHMNYDVTIWAGIVVVIGYLIATCGPGMMSDYRHVRVFGALNAAAVAVLIIVQRSALISLWCVWAAITSVAVLMHLWKRDDGLTPAARREEALVPSA